MGRDKAAMFAGMLGDRLIEGVGRAYEVGPGWTSLPLVQEPIGLVGQGPLAAVAAAAPAVAGLDVVVLACDMPLVTARLLGWLATQPGTAVPVVDGRAQPLCARYAAADVARSADVVGGGGRAMRDLLETAVGVTWLDEQQWSAVAATRDFADVDTEADLERLGVAWPPSAVR
ncbi:MAG: molybdenum cofactor guanylyltransferase [Acidimicrobiaceae bacterium]|jgi:molybdopterin-guanine dinucleotide biosynthesis protein A|nr:molybdenum cofactor guanylyltransferase [Acidimicrobiaceae bacterium]MDQ1445682.1 molybdenum cofactor guanylyltransferase [Acidimicrobiaceae bacterium]